MVPISIREAVAERLRTEAAELKSKFTNDHKARLAAIDAEAAKAEHDARAVAEAQAEADLYRANAELARRIETELAKSSEVFLTEVPTVAAREEMVQYFGASLNAVSNAASGVGSAWLLQEDLYAPALGADGAMHLVPGELVAAVAALVRIHQRETGRADAAQALADAVQRQADRDAFLDEQVADWRSRSDSERSLEGRA